MRGGSLRSNVRNAPLVWFCVCGLTVVLSASAQAGVTSPAISAQDTVAAGTADTVRVDTLRADSTRAGVPGGDDRKSVWKMDELKRVLGDETGTPVPGMKYHERKSGRVAMACALLVPGLGQIYNEKPLKAAIALGVETFYLSRISMNRRYWAREKIVRDAFSVDDSRWTIHDRWVEEYWERSVDWIWWSGAALLVIVIDAYVDAHLDDMRFHVEPRGMEGGIGVSFVVPY
jgi:hypothetical protein